MLLHAVTKTYQNKLQNNILRRMKMTDQEKVQMAFDILDNCREYDRDGDTVLVEIDRDLWDRFNEENEDD